MLNLKSTLFSVTLSLALAASAQGQALRLLVGTYTEGTPAEGVYLYSFDGATAETALLGVAPSGNPSFVIPDPRGGIAYAVNEYSDGREAVSSYEVRGDSIRLLSSVPIPGAEVDGADPCNLLFTGGALVTANYTGGSVTAFPIAGDGQVGAMSQSFSSAAGISHMHCAVLSPDGRYIFVTDLGRDNILRFVREEGEKPLGESSVAWQSTAEEPFGPRHMVFSADGRYAYLLCELGDKLVVFSYADGLLSPIQTLTAYDGEGHGSADIHLSPDGRFLYTSHRLKEDGIGIFCVDPESGLVRRIGYQPTGRHPRNFAISPGGKFLLCGCRDENAIEIYAIDPDTGLLSLTGKTISVGAPVCVQFVSAR